MDNSARRCVLPSIDYTKNWINVNNFKLFDCLAKSTDFNIKVAGVLLLSSTWIIFTIQFLLVFEVLEEKVGPTSYLEHTVGNWRYCTILLFAVISEFCLHVQVHLGVYLCFLKRAFKFAFSGALTRGHAPEVSGNGAKTTIIPVVGDLFVQNSFTVYVLKEFAWSQKISPQLMW